MSNSMEHNLDEELRAIESMLAYLSPRTIPEAMFTRTEQAMDLGSDFSEQEDFNHSDSGDLNGLEVHLSHLSPTTMPDDMLTRMSQAMDRWHESAPEDEKVLAYTTSPRRSSPIFSRGMLSAAATVAVLGAVTALVMSPPATSPKSNFADSGQKTPASDMRTPASSDIEVSQHASISSENLSHKVTSTTDRGVILSDYNEPLRCIRVDYVDQVKGVDAHGRHIVIKTPGIDYLLIPVVTD